MHLDTFGLLSHDLVTDVTRGALDTKAFSSGTIQFSIACVRLTGSIVKALHSSGTWIVYTVAAVR